MRYHALATALLVALTTPACDGASPPAGPATDEASPPPPALAHGSLPRDSDLNRDLARIRSVTARFHRVDVALSEGYAPSPPCAELPPLGSQGIHYVKGPWVDGTVSLTEPEVLQYEPGPGGLRLIGVEYIVPFSAVPSTATPPTLLGRDFHPNLQLGLWALHVWAWRHNPSGLFADWNPKVSC